MSMFSAEENTERVERQKKPPITVIIGNPPYNVGQLNENDNNKNRKYKVIDETHPRDLRQGLEGDEQERAVRSVREVLPLGDGPAATVATASSASSRTTALSTRSPSTGCASTSCRTSRRSITSTLHGNVRQNPKLSGTTHNVFGIQVGVGITIAVRCTGEKRLRYHRVPSSGARKRSWLGLNDRSPHWRHIDSDSRQTWLVPDQRRGIRDFHSNHRDLRIAFESASKTNRDEVVYDFARRHLA